MDAQLVLAEGTPLQVVEAAFAQLGWTAVSDLPPLAQQPSDDRVLAAWSDASGSHSQVSDDGLSQVLHLQQVAPLIHQALARLPHRTSDDVLTALGHRDVRTLIGAVRAAAILGDASLVAGLAPLRRHP